MFVKYDVVDDHLLNNLSQYILTGIVYESFLDSSSHPVPFCEEISCKKTIDNKIPILSTPPRCVSSAKDDIFIPAQEDKLFWCLFIHKFGKNEYNQILTKYKNHEINEKIKIVDYINKNLCIMKTKKINKTNTQEIMGKLMSSSVTDLQCVHGICAYYKLNVIVVNTCKTCYIDYDYSCDDNDEDNILVIFKSSSLMSTTKFDYSLKMNMKKSDVKKITDTYIKFEQYDKPFNGISSYKLSELLTIQEKMGVSSLKKNKAEIFRLINVSIT